MGCKSHVELPRAVTRNGTPNLSPERGGQQSSGALAVVNGYFGLLDFASLTALTDRGRRRTPNSTLGDFSAIGGVVVFEDCWEGPTVAG